MTVRICNIYCGHHWWSRWRHRPRRHLGPSLWGHTPFIFKLLFSALQQAPNLRLPLHLPVVPLIEVPTPQIDRSDGFTPTRRRKRTAPAGLLAAISRESIWPFGNTTSGGGRSSGAAGAPERSPGNRVQLPFEVARRKASRWATCWERRLLGRSGRGSRTKLTEIERIVGVERSPSWMLCRFYTMKVKTFFFVEIVS